MSSSGSSSPVAAGHGGMAGEPVTGAEPHLHAGRRGGERRGRLPAGGAGDGGLTPRALRRLGPGDARRGEGHARRLVVLGVPVVGRAVRVLHLPGLRAGVDRDRLLAARGLSYVRRTRGARRGGIGPGLLDGEPVLGGGRRLRVARRRRGVARLRP
ncbi:hypothetical protein ACFSTC_51560 [Nonomuraea ferruginea]